jgi:hypothetical protein
VGTHPASKLLALAAVSLPLLVAGAAAAKVDAALTGLSLLTQSSPAPTLPTPTGIAPISPNAIPVAHAKALDATSPLGSPSWSVARTDVDLSNPYAELPDAPALPVAAQVAPRRLPKIVGYTAHWDPIREPIALDRNNPY